MKIFYNILTEAKCSLWAKSYQKVLFGTDFFVNMGELLYFCTNF